MTARRSGFSIGKRFPDEYSSSKYTRKTKGARAKAKANAVQGIREMVEIATEKVFRNNFKEKYAEDAKNGWYYYLTRFAMPVYDNENRGANYNVYSASLVVNHAANSRKYLYDIVDIKKKRVTHSMLPNNSQVVQNRFLDEIILY